MRLSCFYPGTVSLFAASLIALPSAARASENPGPSSRRTPLTISEIMYHPANRSDGRNGEFIELYNSEPMPADLSGYRLSGSIDFVFPTNTILPGQSFIVIAAAPEDFAAVYGTSGVNGPFAGDLNSNSLPNDHGTVRLESRSGAVLLEVEYSEDPPWPAAADGSGHSLVLSSPSFGEGNPRAWSASALPGGSPGSTEPPLKDVLSNVRINELFAGDDLSDGYIELYNHSAIDVDLSGCFLSDSASTNKFQVPAGTVLQGNSFLNLSAATLGFAPAQSGGTLYFRAADGMRVEDALRFEPQDHGVAYGRYPDGSSEVYPLKERSPGAANSSEIVGEVIINELMHSPITRDDDEQYIELYNRGTNRVDLSGWKLDNGVSFTVPNGTTVAPKSYVVIARNAALLRTNYPWLNETNTLGNFIGKLSGKGERLTLRKPVTLVATSGTGGSELRTVYPVVDEVTYGTGGRWGQWADGGGSSLELIDPRANHRLAANWADSDESQKAPWTAVEVSGVLDNGTGTPDQLQMLLHGAGECLVDNVEVLDATGRNLIANSSFESGATGWTAEGTQDQSGLETEGYESSRSYHVRAVARGDTGANRIRTPLQSALAPGSVATIRAQVRWLRGFPEFLLRLRGNYLEAPVGMRIPHTLGTPGLANSKASPNAAPAIYEVTHTPVLPRANEPILVTTRVEDPDGLSGIHVHYRVDPGTAYSSLPMVDDGTGGDAFAGDDIYSARIPGQPAGSLVAYYVRAADAFTPSATALFPNDAPARECLVRFGETQPSGSFGTYRLWMTQATFNKWSNRGKLNNTPLDVTFVYNDERIIYNVSALFAGSPYISPGYNTPAGNLCGYTGSFPEDDLFLGTTDFVLDWPGRDNTAVEEQLSYWIADQLDLPNSYRRYIHLHVNGVNEQARGSIYEDVQQPGGEMIKEWAPNDTEGQFYKIERWFEFNDSLGLMSDAEPHLENYTTTGGAKKLARYRWNWLPRAVKSSVNDYTNLFGLVDAVNAPAPEPYTSATEALADIEEMMGIFAVEHIVNNFDSWGHEISKNMYAYKPVNGKWMTFMFDIDWVMKESAGHGYTTSADLFSPTDDPTVARMYSHPPFQRAYYRAIQRAVNGPLLSSRINPVMDAKYAALLANGVTRSAGQSLAAPTPVKTWISQRRNYLVQQLAQVAAPFAITSGMDAVSPTNLLVLNGTAPVEVASIRINGQERQVEWTSVTSWMLEVVLKPGINELLIEALDRTGAVIPNGSITINATFTGSGELPEGNVVINEIMYNPAQPNGEYVELYNRSRNTAFDLSGWRLDGIDYAFAPGTILRPSEYRIVASDIVELMATYGNTIPFAGEFDGRLQPEGETLTLIRSQPGLNDVIVDQVSYANGGAWPALPESSGISLQLIDPAQDNSRVANWRAVTESLTNDPPVQVLAITDTWKFEQSGASLGDAWFENDFDDSAWPSGPGLLYVENSPLPAPKNTRLTIGPASYYFRTHFQFNGDPSEKELLLSTVIDDGAIFYLNGQEVFRIGMPSGPVNRSTFSTRLIGEAAYEGPFTLPAKFLRTGDNLLAVEVHQNNGGSTDMAMGATLSIGTRSSSKSYTPAEANSVLGELALPDVWLNEVQPASNAGPSGNVDNFGERDPWVEVYNSGSSTLDLTSWSLSNGYSNAPAWKFPPGTTIAPGSFRVIWLDGQPEQSTAADLHASFRATSGSGVLVLSYPQGTATAILDYLEFSGIPVGSSFGRLPSGSYTVFPSPTLGTENGSAAPPKPLSINEWMASNVAALADPADGHFEDWFEIYNPNDSAVDMTGYKLSDSLGSPLDQWQVPGGTTIPARGFLLVWADGSVDQNNATNADLHASFRLNKAADAIAIFGPAGDVIDYVNFGPQTDDVSQGRIPDGSTNVVFLPHSTARLTNQGLTNDSLRITRINASGGTVRLTWESEPAVVYTVQFKRELSLTAWANLTEVTATGSETEVADAIDGTAKFYRVVRR